MCSLTINNPADEILKSLNNKNVNMIESRMISSAQDSKVQKRGVLDVAPMKRTPADLREMRKKEIGRHRVYYTGHHTNCTYQIIYVKINKKSGVQDDDDPRFRRLLASVIDRPSVRTLAGPD